MKRTSLVVAVALFAALLTACTGLLNQPPVATFTYEPATVHTGDQVVFDPSGSFDPDSGGSIVLYTWDFGPAIGFEHFPDDLIGVTYSEAGAHTVSLTVTDDHGATGFYERTLEVLPTPAVPGSHEPWVGAYLSPTRPDGTSQTNGVFGMFPGISSHLKIEFALERYVLCEFYPVASDPDDPDCQTAGDLPKSFVDRQSLVDWLATYGETRGISRLRVEVTFPDGSKVVYDTDNPNFSLEEPIFSFVLNDYGDHVVLIKAWDKNEPAGENYAKITITATECTDCAQ